MTIGAFAKWAIPFLCIHFALVALVASASSSNIKLAPRVLPSGIGECKNFHFKKMKIFVPGKKNPKLEHEGYSLKHGTREISCHSCHDVNEGESLRSSSDYPASFANSSPVCQQCHATEYRDWSQGVHGRRTGGWNVQVVEQAQLHCIDCHNPHSVKFKPMKASAAPKVPHGGSAGALGYPSPDHSEAFKEAKQEVEAESEKALLSIPTAAVSVREFPCSRCHSSFSHSKVTLPFKKLVDGKPAHAQITLKHMEHGARCVLCHSSSDPNSLNLVSGDKIPYAKTPELCGQCHGKVLHAWQMGYHGRQQIDSTGKKERLSCGECHNAHHPKFAPMKASAMPLHPAQRHSKEGTKENE